MEDNLKKFEFLLTKSGIKGQKKPDTSATLDDLPPTSPKMETPTRAFDDSKVRHGAKSHKLNQNVHIKRKPICNLPTESKAYTISNEYHTTGTVDYTSTIPNGFYDIVGYDPTRKLPPLLEIPKLLEIPEIPVFPILVVDSGSDPILERLRCNAVGLCGSIPNQEIRIRVLAMFVCNFMGGSQVLAVSGRTLPVLYDSLVKHLMEKYEGKPIPLGEITHGNIRERPLLFKFLCDNLGLSCKLTRNNSFPKVENSFSVWTEVMLDDQAYVVDLLHNASTLYPLNSKEAQAYCKFSDGDCLMSYTICPAIKGEDKKCLRWLDINLNHVEVKLFEEIGKGRHGIVYKSKIGGVTCATKVINLLSLDGNMKKQLNKEILIMETVGKNQNILTVFGSEERGDSVFIFCELWSGSLKSVVLKVAEQRRPNFLKVEVKCVMVGVCKALGYLHTLPIKIIHRDVKSQNILVDLDLNDKIINAVLCDFGISKQVTKKKPIIEPVGTPRWMAPEVHKSEPYNEMVDIWSFGMMLYELLTLQIPYHSVPFLDVKDHIIAGNLPDLDGVQEILADFKGLFFNCTRYKPSERYTITKILDEINLL